MESRLVKGDSIKGDRSEKVEGASTRSVLLGWGHHSG